MVWPFDAYIWAPQDVPPPPPHGDLYWYADVASSIGLGAVRDDGTVLTQWGTASVVTGTPLVVTDSVLGGKAIRTSPSSSIETSAGAADFLVTGPSTAFFVCRALRYNPAGDYVIGSSTAGGTLKGYEARVYDNNADVFKFRVMSPLVFDGASYVVDTPGVQTAGYYLTQRWHIVCMRLTDTALDVFVDGRRSRRVPLTVSWSYLSAGSGPFAIGGGHMDHRAIELYASALTDNDVQATFTRLAARYGVGLVIPIAGDAYTTAQFFGFPNLLDAPGKLYLTYFQGNTEGPVAGNTQHAIESLTDGDTWANDVVLQTSGSSTSYADIATTILSDGSWLQTTYLYALPGGTITHLATRKSANAGATWGAWQDVDLGSHTDPGTFQATGAPPIESIITPGRVIWPCFTLEDGATKTDAFVYISTDYGVTFPTRVRAAHGDADGCNYEEPGIIVETGYLYMLVRRSSGATTMGQLRSTDDAATWSAVDDTTMAATSAARGLIKDSSGAYRWAGARPNNIQEAAMYSRPAGAAWDDDWNNVPVAPWLDPLYGGSAYGGLVETSPGVFTAVWGGNIDPTHNDVVARTGLQAWLLENPPAMPGVVTPTSATLAVTTTLQLHVTGAGGFTYSVSGSTGTTCSSGGLVTAGSVNGAAVVTVRDLNNVIVATCDVTVTGATSNPVITAIWPDAGTASGGTPVTLIGSLFTGATSAAVGGVNLTSFVVVDDNTITGVTGAHAQSLNVDVTVGGGTLSNGFCYLPSTLVRQYDASAGVTITSGKISQLDDLMGVENLVQGTDANRPTLDLTGLNGKPCIVNANPTGLVGSTTPWLTTAGTECALIQTSTVAAGHFFGAQYNGFHDMMQVQVTSGKLLFIPEDGSGEQALSAVLVNDDTPHACIASFDSSSGPVLVYVDSATPSGTAGTSTTPIVGNGDRNCIGAGARATSGDIDAPFVGKIAVGLVFSAALAGADLTLAMGYLKKRGGIA